MESIIARYNENLNEENKYNNIKQLIINFKFCENIISNYNDSIEYKNPHIDPFFEITFIISKFLIAIFTCISSENNKKEINIKKNKHNMLRLFDYILHNFKTLRNKYEDLCGNYFNCDEEHILLYNIRKIIYLEEYKTSNFCEGFVNILTYYSNYLKDFLSLFSGNLFVIDKKEIKKFDKLVN
jgi:hypothetical protein